MRKVALAAALALSVAACATAYPPEPRGAGDYSDYLIGRVAENRADHTAAAERYAAALAHNPSDADLVDAAVRAALASNQPALARRTAHRAAPELAANAALMVRAAEAIDARDWRRAERLLTRVEGRADDELVARVLSSWFRAAHGDVGSAEGAAIRIGGTPALAFQHAMRLDLAGRNAEALSAYAEAERSGAREPTGIEAYADLLARTGARQDAAALLARYAGSAAVDAAAARLAAQGRAAEQPLTAARGAAIGLVELAGVFRRGHDLDAALATLAMAQSLAPELDYVRLVFAQAQRDIGNLSAARALLSEIGANSAYAAPARATEMWMLADAGRNEEALALARANAESGDARALRNLADLYGAMDRYGEAAPIYAQLIEEASQDWSLYFARGVAYERVGNWEQAERDLRVALELAPNQPEVLNYLGYAWADRGERLDEARAMIERAVQMLPASGAVVDSLGWVHYRQGDYQRAADLLERAVQLSPVNPTLNDHLGDAYWRLGRRTEARNQWRRALGLDPEHPDPIRVKLERGLPEDAGLRP